jgi:hypothetical protein
MKRQALSQFVSALIIGVVYASLASALVLTLTRCTTWHNAEQIESEPKVQYATESHWWMIPKCIETDRSGENQTCPK